MPGGVIEMANIAKRIDADPLPIMVLQTMRVGLTVCAAPFVVTALAEAGARNVVAQGEVMSWLTVLALMGASFVGGFFLNRFALPNAWFLGSLFVMAALGAHRPDLRPRARADPGGGAGHHRDDRSARNTSTSS